MTLNTEFPLKWNSITHLDSNDLPPEVFIRIKELRDYVNVKKYIHWNNLIKAPISNFMDLDELHNYCFEQGLYSNSTAFLTIPIIFLPFDMEFLKAFLTNNRAGVNGETIDWDTIKELYK